MRLLRQAALSMCACALLVLKIAGCKCSPHYLEMHLLRHGSIIALYYRHWHHLRLPRCAGTTSIEEDCQEEDELESSSPSGTNCVMAALILACRVAGTL